MRVRRGGRGVGAGGLIGDSFEVGVSWCKSLVGELFY